MAENKTENKLAAEEKTVAKSEKPANIVYIGENEPPISVNVGTMKKIKLPPVEVQAEVKEDEIGRKTYKGKPFYHENAAILVNSLSTLYKRVVPKG